MPYVRSLLVVLASFGCLGCLVPQAPGQQDPALALRFQPRVGTPFGVRLGLRTEQDIQVGGRTLKASTNENQDLVFRIVRPEGEGRLLVQVSFQRIWGEMMMPEPVGSFSWDSEKTPPKDWAPDRIAMAKAETALAFKTLTCVIDSTGRVLEATGHEAEIKAFLDSEAASQLSPEFTRTLRLSAPDDNFRRMIQRLFPILPKDAATTGEEWGSGSFHELTDDGYLSIEMKSKLEGQEEGSAVITFQGRSGGDGTGSGDPARRFSGSIEGRARIATSSGWIERLEHRATLKGSTPTPAGMGEILQTSTLLVTPRELEDGWEKKLGKPARSEGDEDGR
jgi:hypothetical protein